MCRQFELYRFLVAVQGLHSQGSYTSGPQNFQVFSRTFQDHILQKSRSGILRKKEKNQTAQSLSHLKIARKDNIIT